MTETKADAPLPSFVPNDTPRGKARARARRVRRVAHREGRQEKIFSKPQNNAHPRVRVLVCLAAATTLVFRLLLRQPKFLISLPCGGRNFGFSFALRRPHFWLFVCLAAAATLIFRLPCGGRNFGFRSPVRRPQFLIGSPVRRIIFCACGLHSGYAGSRAPCASRVRGRTLYTASARRRFRGSCG